MSTFSFAGSIGRPASGGVAFFESLQGDRLRAVAGIVADRD